MTINKDYTTLGKVIALTKYSEISPRIFQSLIEYFGTIENIFESDTGSLMSIDGMTPELADKILCASDFLEIAEIYIEELKLREIRLESRFGVTYPPLFFEINDPPTLLYYRGMLPDTTKKTVVIAGSDNAGNEGIELAVRFADTCARNDVQVVSSLNKGVDAAALLGCSTAAGHAFGVLESGFDEVYPRENVSLAIDIVKKGGLISEYPPDIKYNQQYYESSNRILVGMSQAVVISEIYKDSHRIMDLLRCCSEVGKLSFIIINPEFGAQTDTESLEQAVRYGAIPLVGFDKFDDIIKSLV